MSGNGTKIAHCSVSHTSVLLYGNIIMFKVYVSTFAGGRDKPMNTRDVLVFRLAENKKGRHQFFLNVV